MNELMHYLDKILNRELKNEKNYCRSVKTVIFNRLIVTTWNKLYNRNFGISSTWTCINIIKVSKIYLELANN